MNIGCGGSILYTAAKLAWFSAKLARPRESMNSNGCLSGTSLNVLTNGISISRPAMVTFSLSPS